MGQYSNWASTQLAPTFLQGPWGQKWTGTLGAQSDVLVGAAQQAVGARFIQTCPADALAFIGADRQLPRYTSDSDASYRARLQAAWQTWQQAGTYGGLYGQLNAFGFQNIGIFDVHGDASVPGGTGVGPDGFSPWPPDNNTANWSRFWVALSNPFPPFLAEQLAAWAAAGIPVPAGYDPTQGWQPTAWGTSPPAGYSAWNWGGANPSGSPWTWGSTATAAQVASIQALIRQWKPVQCVCAGIWLCFSNIPGTTTKIAAGSGGSSLPQSTIDVASTTNFPPAGNLLVTTAAGPQFVQYTGISGGDSFTGCTGGTGLMSTNGDCTLLTIAMWPGF